MKSLKKNFSFHIECKNFILDVSVKFGALSQLLYDYYLVCLLSKIVFRHYEKGEFFFRKLPLKSLKINYMQALFVDLNIDVNF
jgi:hypothetical protein